MANRHRGEIDAVLDGKSYRLCLTLGALAELESAFGDEDMLALATRFETGRISARDCQRIIGAGLRGAGFDVSDLAVAAMCVEGGAAGYVDIVARLLATTFAAAPGSDVSDRQGGEAAGPFPGGT
ncbi:gene transfer agent family protein [Hyphomicrobium sp.]|uniref:gene transfer agent family protein n=1 Tax=Hyphomicrobium sp. TaxID=82 RepID=UPI002CE3174E|nr:gene transfer agent family protein [Hyphomicrobium sp.]HRN88680.1 gene transfer agent family protein [Hyphomicrobium sp.]HRQ26287.1 gene transfer agent family protein [Hyphomicrobium sp.]